MRHRVVRHRVVHLGHYGYYRPSYMGYGGGYGGYSYGSYYQGRPIQWGSTESYVVFGIVGVIILIAGIFGCVACCCLSGQRSHYSGNSYDDSVCIDSPGYGYGEPIYGGDEVVIDYVDDFGGGDQYYD